MNPNELNWDEILEKVKRQIIFEDSLKWRTILQWLNEKDIGNLDV